jgi:hypothetical protein
MTFRSEKKSSPATPPSLESESKRRPLPPPSVSPDAARRFGHSLDGYAVFPPNGGDVLQRTPDPESVDEILDQVPSELPHEHGTLRGEHNNEPGAGESKADCAHEIFDTVGKGAGDVKDALEFIPGAEKFAGPLEFLGLDAHAGAMAADYDADGKSSRPRVGRSLDAISHGMEMASDFLPKPFKPVMKLGAKAFEGEAWVDEHQDTVLDNPLVSKMFAMAGLDYREPPKPGATYAPETVAPAISEEEWRKTYGTFPSAQ